MSDILRVSGDAWDEWEPAVREKLSRSGFDATAINWVCHDMAPRWRRLPASNEVAISTTEEHADAVSSAVEAVQSMNNETNLEFANMVLDLEIDLYYALNPPQGGTKLRLVA